jgi:hypothetical protein
VPELVNILRTDKDEDHREHAAEELKQYDPGTFPEIVPALMEALRDDKKPTVRAEAASSLGKLRPVSDTVGQALENALSNDPSMRVRMQARSSLLQYHWAGYHSGKKPDTPPSLTGKEPPVADPGKYPPAINTSRSGTEGPRLSPVPAPAGRYPTPPPPPIKPAPSTPLGGPGLPVSPTPISPPASVSPAPLPPSSGSGPRPLPSGPQVVPLPENKSGNSQTPASNEGPDLGPSL